MWSVIVKKMCCLTLQKIYLVFELFTFFVTWNFGPLSLIASHFLLSPFTRAINFEFFLAHWGVTAITGMTDISASVKMRKNNVKFEKKYKEGWKLKARVRDYGFLGNNTFFNNICTITFVFGQKLQIFRTSMFLTIKE